MLRLGLGADLACGAALVAALMFSGCGRVGVNLLPQPTDAPKSDASVADSGTSTDSGTPIDAMDSGAAQDSGMLRDSGTPDTCPTVCENPNGTASCESGSCQASCATGYSDCDSNPTNGCETDISTDLVSCGACLSSCVNDHGSVVCGSGLCEPTCQAGYSDCDAIAANGCEASLSTVSACGACGVACTNAHGTTSCVAGTCTPVCAPGYTDCDGDPKNGCEANTNTDPTRCGSCTNACPGSNLVCVGGACQVSTCPAGNAECDGDLAVTCETNTTTSVGNCGFCANACTTPNGTPRCTTSACQVQSCNNNYANCDNGAANGCEVNLRTNLSNCGSCGTACTNAHGATSCTASACVPSCSTGWGDCDASRPNGCETQLNSTTNCGTCGNICPAVTGGTPICNAGICGASCNLTGTWALKITSATTWPNDTYIRGGSGNHVFWLRMTANQSGNTVTESMIECGRKVPDFAATMVSETYGFSLMSSLFDHAPPYLPASSATLTLGNSSPGASVSQPLTAFLMGTTLSNPTTANWPNAASGLTQVDMDADADPGVRVTYLSGGGYDHPRVSASLFATRAVNPYVASRLVFSLQGALTSCTQASGPATVTHIDTRIFGCELESGSNCNGSQAGFLDMNCVNYTVGSSTYTMLKIANGASCAAVRSALP